TSRTMSDGIRSGYTRRRFLGTTITASGASLLLSQFRGETPMNPPTNGLPADTAFGELDAKIRDGMRRYHIPRVAVGVLAQGREYVQGYGVTNVDYPVPIDGDTLFRIGSTTKTFTGTTVMVLVDQGTLDLRARVRTYLPDFQTADPSVAARVTLRQLLNHSA